MALQDPREIVVSGTTSDLLSQVDEALAALNQRRPFNDETERRLRTEFLPDRVTATLNVEGIGVTRRQTLAVMDAMSIESMSSRDEQEIANVLKADGFVYDSALAEKV